MRLYLSANSMNGIGYIPDWLKVKYNAELGQDLELTLDIQGDVDYDNDRLSCSCKGDLIPWTLTNCKTGEETDLSELGEEEVNNIHLPKKLVDILRTGTEFKIGVYPADDSEENLSLAKTDIFTNCSGLCEISDGEAFFEFEVEITG